VIRLKAKHMRNRKWHFFTCWQGITHITPDEVQGACGTLQVHTMKSYRNLKETTGYMLCYSCFKIAEEALGARVPDDLSEVTPF
jgi:hypothetical protein